MENPGDEVQQTAASCLFPGTVDRVKDTYLGSVSPKMSPTTLVVQDKGTIGPIPHSTTQRQLSDALWNWSGGVGTPWKVISLRILPIKGRKRSWPLGAEKPPPAMELTLPSGKVFVQAEMTGRRKARTDVGDDETAKGPAPSRGS